MFYALTKYIWTDRHQHLLIVFHKEGYEQQPGWCLLYLNLQKLQKKVCLALKSVAFPIQAQSLEFAAVQPGPEVPCFRQLELRQCCLVLIVLVADAPFLPDLA